MSKPAIIVDDLSKSYRIGHKHERHTTFRDALVGAMHTPFKRLGALARGATTTASETFWALKGVSFEVQPGEVVGIIGRNGAGKSTLLKILSRITEPTSGNVRLRGRVASLLEVGTGFHPELTGRENIYLNGAILGMKRAEIARKFDEIVAFAEIEKFLDTPVKFYSSGMYVRLAFAVAAHLEPEILIVDEVLAVGDAEFQKKCLGKMKQVARGEGRTVLLVSHNMGAIHSLCTQSVLLSNGRAEAVGPTSTVVNQYLVAFSAGSSCVFELPPQPRVNGCPGYGVSLRSEASDGSPRNCFRIFEPWYAVLDFDILIPSRHVIAALGIQNSDGIPIATFFSQPEDLVPGRYTARFECDLPLSNQGLQFAVGLSSREQGFYYVDAVGRVLIEDVAVGKQPLRSSNVGILVSNRRPSIMPATAGRTCCRTNDRIPATGVDSTNEP